MKKKQLYDGAFRLTNTGFVFVAGKVRAKNYVLCNLRGEPEDKLLPISLADMPYRQIIVIAHPGLEKREIWEILDDDRLVKGKPTIFGNTRPGILQNGHKGIFAIGTLATGFLLSELQIICGDDSPLFLPPGIRRSIFKPADNSVLDGLIYLLISWNPFTKAIHFFKSQDDPTLDENI